MSELGNKLIFAKNLKKYMEINEVDRNELCRQLDIKYTTLADWCNGKTYPRIDKIDLLAEYFNINKSDLIDGISFGSHDDTIQLVNIKYVKLIPVLGKIPAGVPFEAVEEAYTTDYETIPLEMTNGGKEYFALKLKGDSMEPEYKDGSTVVFLKTSDFTSGQDCCVMVNDDDATFKRVTIRDNGILLTPLNMENNSGFLPKFFTNEEIQANNVRVLGVVKRYIKNID